MNNPIFENAKDYLADCIDALSELNNLTELSDTERFDAKDIYTLCEVYMQSIECIIDWNEY